MGAQSYAVWQYRTAGRDSFLIRYRPGRFAAVSGVPMYCGPADFSVAFMPGMDRRSSPLIEWP